MHRSLAFQSPPSAQSGSAVLAKGFRPFFLLAAAYAAMTMPLWLLVYVGALASPTYLAPMTLHAHEMVFGFGGAVVAGFLLTAVGNWTKRETATGGALAGLCALWAAGRVALLASSVLSPTLVALVDLAFVPALTVAVARPLVAAKNRRNFVILVVMGALFVANLCVHLDALGLAPGWQRRGCLLGVDVLVLLMVIIGGRVIPMFTRNATGVAAVRSVPALDVVAIVSTALLLFLDVTLQAGALVAVAAGVAGLANAVRTTTWGARYAGRERLLLILHIGYAWIPFGLLLRASALFTSAVPSAIATHALTAGAIGSLTLGMMARVALGHTGRPLAASKWLRTAFALVSLSAVVRVTGPVFFAESVRAAMILAGALWTAAFTIYGLTFGPILISHRVDGRAG